MLIIFDLDGTLIDSLPGLTTSINFVAEKYGKTANSDIVRRGIGNGAGKLLMRSYAALGITGYDFETEFTDYREHYLETCESGTVLFPDVEETLLTLKKSGYTLACATMKPHCSTLLLLKSLKIAHYFEFVMSAEEMQKPKPDPSFIFELARISGEKLSDIIMVGDSENDMIAARGAGVLGIGVFGGYCEPEVLSEFADNVLENISQVVEIIKKRG